MGLFINPTWQNNYFHGGAPIKNLHFQIRNPIAPTSTELIGRGKAKLVFSGYREAEPASDPSKRSYLTSKIDDVVYMISRKRFFNNELKDELRIGPKIRKRVYLANLRILLQSLGMPAQNAKTQAKELASSFPTVELLIEGIYRDDPKLKDFFQQYHLQPLDRQSPQFLRLLDSCLHLSVDFVYAPTIQIQGKSAVLAKKAECDLEAAVRKRNYTFPQNIELVKQLFSGFRDLHAAGYIHGDPKLENVLLYSLNGKPLLKIADWGKCKTRTPTEKGFHTGNHRHMPPERLSSQKGEVFSAAMMAIRILEEEFLAGDPHAMLIDPEKTDPKKEKCVRKLIPDPEKSRKGIEKYLCISKGCPQIDANWSDAGAHILGSMKEYLFESHPDIDPHLAKYLSALHEKLKARYGNSDQMTELIHLFKAMMQSNVRERISMEEATSRVEALCPKR